MILLPDAVPRVARAFLRIRRRDKHPVEPFGDRALDNDSGLDGGETLIVEGLANVTEGSPVDAHAVPGDDTDAAQ